MRHRKKKKLQYGYDKNKRLLRSFAAALVLYEKIELTDKRGKVVKSAVEKLISKGKVGDLHNKRQLFAALPKNAARKVFEVLGPKYKDRAGGYTRLVGIEPGKDGSRRVKLELV